MHAYIFLYFEEVKDGYKFNINNTTYFDKWSWYLFIELLLLSAYSLLKAVFNCSFMAGTRKLWFMKYSSKENGVLKWISSPLYYYYHFRKI